MRQRNLRDLLTRSLVPMLVLIAGAAHAFQVAPNPERPNRPDRSGAITEIKGDVYSLEGRQGTITVSVPPAASVEGVRGASATRADLKVGARIGVFGADKDGAFVATRVVLMPARAAGAGRGTGAAPPRPAVQPIVEHGITYPVITIDTTGAPDMAGFAARAKAICEAQYAPIAEYLKSDGFTPPVAFKLIFREMDGVAYASGDEIHFSAKFFRANPQDYGAAVHEMTHIIQHYRGGNNPGWLVEAVDDYVRFYRYEPVTNLPKANPDRVGDEPEAYRVGAQFLDWSQTKYAKDLVPQLNAAMREGRYKDEIFQEKTGKTLKALWAEWKTSLRAPAVSTASASK